MRKLELKFLNAEGKVVTYTLDQPNEPADSAAVNGAMNTIISNNIFQTSGGDLLEKHSARIVERIVDDIEL